MYVTFTGMLTPAGSPDLPTQGLPGQQPGLPGQLPVFPPQVWPPPQPPVGVWPPQRPPFGGGHPGQLPVFPGVWPPMPPSGGEQPDQGLPPGPVRPDQGPINPPPVVMPEPPQGATQIAVVGVYWSAQMGWVLVPQGAQPK